MERDPGELHDVAAEHPEVVARLQRLADVMRADLGDDLTGAEGSGRRPAGRVTDSDSATNESHEH
jgi:arylsulfatase A